MAVDANSEQWPHLSDDDRFEIVEAARDRFAIAFGELSDVNYVGNNCERIYVETRLPHGDKLGSLPDVFESFPIMQTGVREAMDRFIDTWATILIQIGGRSAEDAGKWASDDHRHFRCGFFLHDSPLKVIAMEVIPEDLHDNPYIERMFDEAVLAQRPRNLWHPDLDPDFDWDAARCRVQSMIDELRRERIAGQRRL